MLESRAGRKNQILMQMSIRYKNGLGNGCTCATISRALGLQPSTYMRQLLAELVVEGRLGIQDTVSKGRWPGYWYFLRPDMLNEINKKSRKVPVKVMGKVEGQLTLW